MEAVAIFTEEQINKLVFAAVEHAMSKLPVPINNNVVEEELLSAKEAMALLGIKTAKRFISYRKQHKIKSMRTGKGNMYKKTDLIK